MERMVKFGPKKMGGSIWDDGGKTEIVQILISHDLNGIRAIQFVYAVDQNVVCSEMHGEPIGSIFDEMTFNHPEEYLVSISGEYTSGRLLSITFSTNNRKFGPFGITPNDFHLFLPLNEYAYNFTKSSFGGFHGGVGSWGLSAIGVYIRPLSSLAEIETNQSEDDTRTCYIG